MSYADVEVSKWLDASSELTELMDRARGQPLDINPVYVGTPEDDFLKEKNAPWVRVTMIPGDLANYADDERAIEYPRVQIDFWISKYQLTIAEQMQQLVYQLLKQHGYERYYDYHGQDPDLTGLLMVTGNFEFQGLG